MPKFRVTSPDGQNFDVEGPEGSTQEQALAQVQAQYKPTSPSGSAYTGIPEAVANIGSGMAGSAAGGMAGILTALGNVVGLTDTSPAETVWKIQEAMTYQPRTSSGRAISSAIATPFELLAKGADIVGGGVTDIASKGGLSPSLSAGLGTTANVGIQSLPQLVSMGVKYAPKIGEAAQKARLFSEQARNIIQDTALTEARRANFVLAPSEASPGLINNFLEGFGGKVKTQQSASIRNVHDADAAVRQGLGLSQDAPLVGDTYRLLRSEAGKDYEAIRGIGRITTDSTYLKELNDIKARFESAAQDFGKAAKSEIPDLVKNLTVRSFDASSAVDMVRILRENSDKAFKTGDMQLGRANKLAANALDDMMSRHVTNEVTLPPDVVNKYLSARQRIAESYSAQNATNEATGHINPQDLAKEFKAGRALSPSLKTIARTAAAFPKSMQNTAGIGGVPSISPVEAGMGGTIAAIMHDPRYLLALGIPPAARGLVLSKPYQSAMIGPQSYQPGMGITVLRNMPFALGQGLQQGPQ